MIETELREVLVLDSSVAALVGDRVALTSMPQEEERPYIVCQLVTGQRTGSLSSTGRSSRKRMQISCFANTYLKAKELAEAAQNAVEVYEKFSVVFSGEQDLQDPVTKLFYTVLDYSITQHVN